MRLLFVIELSLLTAASGLGKDRPSILFILTDDQGWPTLGCYGGKMVPTPNLDKLAAEGAKFTDFYVTSQCTPTRASFLTGQYTARHKIWHVPGYEYPHARMAEPKYRSSITRETFSLAKGLRKYRDMGYGEEGPNRSIYLAGLEHVDHSIGRLMEALEEMGEAKGTLVIFTSDNGGIDQRLRFKNLETPNIGEMRNLMNSEPDVARRLRRELLSWMADLGAARPVANEAFDPGMAFVEAKIVRRRVVQPSRQKRVVLPEGTVKPKKRRVVLPPSEK